MLFKFKKFRRILKKDAPLYWIIIPIFLSITVIIESILINNIDYIKSDAELINIAHVQAQIPTKSTKDLDLITEKKYIDRTVPIFMFHYLQDNESAENEVIQKLSVSREKFENILKITIENGVNFLTMSEFNNDALYEKNIALTFDDGYRDFYTNAFPLLKKYSAKATVYLIRGKINENNYLTNEMIDEMKASGLVEFGSHTLSHPNLLNIDENKARTEIFESKLDAVSFCYPLGKFDDAKVNLVKEAGYTTATTTEYGLANQESNKFLLPRIRITNEFNFSAFIKNTKWSMN